MIQVPEGPPRSHAPSLAPAVHRYEACSTSRPALADRPRPRRLRLPLPAHGHPHPLFLQRTRRRRLPPARPNPKLVSHPIQRPPHLGFGPKQSVSGRSSHANSSTLRNPRRASARSRPIPRQSPVPPPGPIAADSPRHNHRPLAINAVPSSRSKTKPGNHSPRTRHRANLRSHHRSLRRIAKTRPRPGRSLARLRRDLLANLLAHHRPQSQALHHRSSPPDLHPFHGRNSRKLLPDRPRQHPPPRNLGTPPPRHHSRDQRHLDHHLCVLADRDSVLVSPAHAC